MTRKLGTLTIYRTYYLLDDVVDGDYPRDNVEVRKFVDVTASAVAQLLIQTGLSFAATGGNWAADPDGSYTVDYSTGLQCEKSGHLSGFPARLESAIVAKVG